MFKVGWVILRIQLIYILYLLLLIY